MLVERLQVTLADFMPAKGVVLSIAGERDTPFRISERLHAALRVEAEQRGTAVSKVFAELRAEVLGDTA